MILYNDAGQELKDPKEWQKKDCIFIQFDKSDEPENFCEISISEDEIKFIDDDNINISQRIEVIGYAEEAQQAIIESLKDDKDREDTNYYLNKTANW